MDINGTFKTKRDFLLFFSPSPSLLSVLNATSPNYWKVYFIQLITDIPPRHLCYWKTVSSHGLIGRGWSPVPDHSPVDWKESLLRGGIFPLGKSTGRKGVYFSMITLAEV